MKDEKTTEKSMERSMGSVGNGEVLLELEKQMIYLRYLIEHGRTEKSNNMSFAEWFREWMDKYKKNTVKMGTINVYNKHYSIYLDKPLGGRRLVDINAEDIQELLNNMANEGYSDNTIKLTYCILSGIFKQAYKNELIPKDPFIRITRPRGTKAKERVAFTKEQQELYMYYAQGSHLCNLFQLAICTGMRNGELAGLLWSDIDFKNRVIHVRHTLIVKDSGGYVLDTPKTRTSVRDIPMIGKAYDILRAQEKDYRRMNNGITGIKSNDFVFSVMNEPIRRKTISREIECMLERMRADGVEFPYFTLHATRHTFATRCIEEGMQPQVLKTILGHATLGMTMDLYSHVLPDFKRDAMEKVANAF
ncbi:MAG: site-specific integrase [Lachnospiraceae bacterium]|nr:site-specific integrase [Lachnospiraceae bacterium]